MSTPGQLRGDSLHRQLTAAREYVEKHGLDLLEADQLRDIGVSAFKGDNVAEGAALGRFMAAVRSGRIATGSYLLVEDLDRLSRQAIFNSLALVVELVTSGIVVVTLSNGKRYDTTTGPGDLIMSIISMERAHDESRMKSYHKKNSWKAARERAHEKRMTRKAPRWLRPTSGDGPPFFEVIPKRAAVVRDIFERSARGTGVSLIAQRLNTEGTETFGGSNGWYDSYVQKILSNRAVLGEMQPGERVGNRRVPKGDPIKGYYPRIIEPDLFNRVQAGLRSRRGKGGRKGRNVANLFSGGHVRCFYCDGSMTYENKGLKSGSSFICDNARRGLGCIKTRWPYRDLQTSFLLFVSRFDWQGVVRDDGGKRSTLENQREALKGQLAELQGRIEKLLKVQALTTSSAPIVAQELDKIADKLSTLEKKLRDKEAEILALEFDRRALDAISPDIEALDAEENEATYAHRLAIQSKLRSIVSHIVLAPAGDSPEAMAAADRMNVDYKALNNIELDKKAIDKLLRTAERYLGHLKDTPEECRYFIVSFVSGHVQIVRVDLDDPTAITLEPIEHDAFVLDLSDAAVQKLIRTVKKRGYVTHDEINSVMPSEEVSNEQIEGVLAMFSEMGVKVVETESKAEEPDPVNPSEQELEVDY
jgi:DNA invertase Pin-like site-specific DNA recombinase